MASDEVLLDEELRALSKTHSPFAENLRKSRALAGSALAAIVRLNPHDETLDGPQRWQLLLWAFLDAAAIAGNTARTKGVRQDIRRARELTVEIRGLARELARKLRARATICDAHDLSRQDDWHPVDLLHEAAYIADQHTKHRSSDVAVRYRRHIAPTLAELDERFDATHWPTTADMLDALANLQDAEHQHEPMDDAAYAATGSPKTSVRDFWRALSVRLQEIRTRHDVNIELPDQDFVDLTAALLDSPPGCTLDNFRNVGASSATP